MKKNLVLWGTAVVLVIVALYVTKYNNGGNNPILPESKQGASSQSASSTSKSAGEKALDFTLTDLDGNKVSLSDFRGKSVYLNFWATWCPPCREEMPEIENVYQQYKDKDFVVLAVDIGEDRNTVNSFIEQNNFNFKVLLDTDQSVALKYNINAIPVSYFIDKEGNVAAKRVGALTEEVMQSYVKALLNE